MHDLSCLIDKWKNSALNFREAETLINLLIVDNYRLESDVKEKKQVVPIDIISDLQTICEAAELKRANFGFPKEEIVTKPHLMSEIREHPTKYIKKTTSLYRKTWIIRPLADVIERLMALDT